MGFIPDSIGWKPVPRLGSAQTTGWKPVPRLGNAQTTGWKPVPLFLGILLRNALLNEFACADLLEGF
jgi:hypothetical protein